MKEIVKKLCIDKGVSGSETEMLDVIKELVGDFAEKGLHFKKIVNELK